MQSKISNNILKGQELEVLYNYTIVANGFAAVVPYGSLDDIRDIPEVSSVYIAPEFKVAPDMKSSVTEAGGMENSSGYNGENTVIAIVDSGPTDGVVAYIARIGESDSGSAIGNIRDDYVIHMATSIIIRNRYVIEMDCIVECHPLIIVIGSDIVDIHEYDVT